MNLYFFLVIVNSRGIKDHIVLAKFDIIRFQQKNSDIFFLNIYDQANTSC